MGQKWTIDKIVESLVQSEEAVRRDIRILGSDIGANWLKLDLDAVEIVIGLSDEQILVSTALEAVSEVPRQDEFNRRLLETQRLLPLSAFAIVKIGDIDHYELMGELSTESTIANIVEEIVTIANNAKEALEMIVAWKAQG